MSRQELRKSPEYRMGDVVQKRWRRGVDAGADMDARATLWWMFGAEGGGRLPEDEFAVWLAFGRWITRRSATDPAVQDLLHRADAEAVAELLAGGWKTRLTAAAGGGVRCEWQRGLEVCGNLAAVLN